MAAGDALGRGFNAGLHAHVPRHAEAQGAGQARALSRPVRRASACARARTLREFDDVVTAPLHGFRDTDDYWTRASAKPRLAGIRVPTLVLNARNDPFLPARHLPDAGARCRARCTLELPDDGGHVGFVSGRFPGTSRLAAAAHPRLLRGMQPGCRPVHDAAAP